MNRPGSLIPNSMEGKVLMRREAILTAVGGIGLLPALILVTAGLSGSQVPKTLDSPVFVMGGLLLAVVTGLVVATRWEIHQEQGGIRISCTIRRRLANLVVLGVALGLLAIIAVYLFTENFQSR